MDYYEAWQDMEIEGQWFLDDPFDKEGNELYGWHFTSGKSYDNSVQPPVYTKGKKGEEIQNDVLPLPVSTKIREPGKILPVSFGGLDVPYVNQRIKDVLEELAGNSLQFIPIIIEEAGLQYYIMNVLSVLDAVSLSSEIEHYIEEEIVFWNDPERTNEPKYIRKLVLSQNKIPQDVKIFRLKSWLGTICVNEQIKEAIERAEKNHGMSFEKIPLE